MPDFRLLGPVEVWAEGSPIDVGEPRRRTVLAALLVDAGSPVRSATLINRVWGDSPPEQAGRTLATHISRLRGVLAAAACGGEPTPLLPQARGYRLVVERGQVDLHRFRQLLGQARDPAVSDEQRVVLLRQAIDLWRGEPLSGVRGEWAQRTRDNLVRERLDAMAAWAQAEVDVANPAVVIAPLTELSGEHPLVEPLTAVLLRALVAVGRRADALERCRLHRRRLMEELGTDQGPELQSLYQSLLRNDEGPPAVAPPARRSPAQLPPDVAGFAGRATYLDQLDALRRDAGSLPGAKRGSGPEPVRIAVLSGAAGVGKTALAVHWAHRVADRFPDGQLYVNLGGFDPGGNVMSASAAVRGFLHALHVPADRIPADLNAQVSLYRTEMADRRMLIVLDDALDGAQVRALLPGASTCLVVVTSRHQLKSLIAGVGAVSIAVEHLTLDEGRELLSRRLGEERVSAERDAVRDIVTFCGRLPLALALIAAHAALRPHAPLRSFAAELLDDRGRWRALASDDPTADVRAVFSRSYAALHQDAARTFRLLGLHPGPDIGAAAVASLSAVTSPQVEAVLSELCQAGMLTEHVYGRYALHDLLRAFAADLALTADTDREREAATRRILDHYLHTAHTASRLLRPHRDPNPLPLDTPEPGVVPEGLGDHAGAMAWFTAEHRVLMAVVNQAAGADRHGHVWKLAWALTDYHDRTGAWQDDLVVLHTALTAAEKITDPEPLAIIHRMLGNANTAVNEFALAQHHYARAHDLYRQIGDLIGAANTHVNLDRLNQRRGRNDEALAHMHQALALYRQAGHRLGEAGALNNIGWLLAQLGDHRQALDYCQQALVLLRDLDDHVGQAATWDSLGYIHHHLENHDRAIDSYRRALDLYRRLGHRFEEASTMTKLGDVYLGVGRREAARRAWTHSLRILDALGHPDSATLRDKIAAQDAPPRPRGITDHG